MITNLVISISFLIAIIALVLVIYKHKYNRNVWFMSGFLIVYAIQSVVVSITSFGGPVLLYAILLNNFAPLYYLSPVLFYFSVRSGITDSIRFRKADILHLIPFTINLIAIIPYLMTDFSYKYEIAGRVMADYYEYMQYDFKLFYPPYINQIARQVIFLGYLAASLLIIRKVIPLYKESTGVMRSQFRFMIRTVYLAVGLFSFFTISQLIVYLEFFLNINLEVIHTQSRYLMWFSTFLYLVIPVYILLNPEFLYGLPRIKLKEMNLMSQKQADTDVLPDNENKVYEVSQQVKSSIRATKSDDEFFILLTDRIMDHLKKEKPYLDVKFSAHQLCVDLDMPRHHLHYCLNMILNKSFTVLKNELRVDYAMELMKNNTNTNLTIEGVGRNSGFASNSNFYAAFRQVTGLTPNQWMEQHHYQSSKHPY